MDFLIENCDYVELFSNIENDSIDLLVTDPPYKTTKRGNSGGTSGILKSKEFLNGDGGLEYNNVDFSYFFNECFRILKNGSHFYIFTNNKNLLFFLKEIEKTDLKIFKNLIWVKNNCITNMYYMDSHEIIIFGYKGFAKKINNCGSKTTLFFENPRNKIHPNQKPVELIDVLINNSSNQGDLVVDPFMGSGSTFYSSLKNKRFFIGSEIDGKFFKNINKTLN